jgi:glycerol-3-phosphate acyltransferase PlsY
VVGAYYIVRLRSGADIRASGSGNAGARNVMRSGDRTAAILTFVWDLAKGALAVALAAAIDRSDWSAGVAFLFIVLGHIWPAQLGFRGGKGVATAIGGTVMLAVVQRSWPSVAAAAAVWVIVFIAHRPAFERHRQAFGGVPTPTRENGS